MTFIFPVDSPILSQFKKKGMLKILGRILNSTIMEALFFMKNSYLLSYYAEHARTFVDLFEFLENSALSNASHSGRIIIQDYLE